VTNNVPINRQQGGSELSFESTASLNVLAGAAVNFGNTRLYFGQDIPTLAASPGALYFRSDGSASNMYVNTSDGVSGSVWKGASVFN